MFIPKCYYLDIIKRKQIKSYQYGYTEFLKLSSYYSKKKIYKKHYKSDSNVHQSLVL